MNHTRTFRPQAESLEARTVPATFTVTTLADAGAGSLRQAILDTNAAPGADVIEFDVPGTIELTTSALPAITDPVNIDGTTAPGFAAAPVVEVDYNGFAGLRFAAGSNGSTLRATGHVNAAGAGVTLESRNTVVAGNYIGVELDGTTAAGNTGDGIRIRTTSGGNTIGGTGVNDANVISGNGGNGVTISASARNRLVANLIGTDATGLIDVGNAGHGVLVANGATANTIGGDTQVAVSGQKPPDGNIISGNGGNGVLLTSGARFNNLSGNFIGTDATGIAALGNALDGVLIDGADDNSLIGTYRNLAPFVFFNVISGNEGNGLRVRNSDNTVVHANFFGLGADNDTVVPNAFSGVVVEGLSANTIFGGVIPLGNVTAGNGQHGVVVRGAASGFVSFNTFAGVGKFTPNPNLGNTLDGFHITSVGGGTVLKTSVISGNGDDGVEISGAARGVQIVQCLIGTNTPGTAALGNTDNGVEVGGTATGIVIGGPQPDYSVAPHNVISGNLGHGVAVVGAATGTAINFSFIGTDSRGETAIPNGESGVFLGGASTGTVVGSRTPALLTVVSGNTARGIEIQGSTGNVVIGTLVGTNQEGRRPIPNLGSGVFIADGFDNRVGGVAPRAGNTIAFNLGSGVTVLSGVRNSIRGNSIHANAVLGIDLLPGANRDLAAPVLTSALPLPGQIRVAGNVVAGPNSAVTIDVFANFDEELLPVTEGEFYLGSVTVTTNARGRATFVFTGYNPPPGVQVFTATATDSRGNTSEFAAGIQSLGP